MLTNTQAREAKPRTIRYEITCDALPGFILRVLPTGKKVFFARYRDAGGKDRRFRLGLLRPGFGVEEARREALTILARRDAPASEDAPDPAEPFVTAPGQRDQCTGSTAGSITRKRDHTPDKRGSTPNRRDVTPDRRGITPDSAQRRDLGRPCRVFGLSSDQRAAVQRGQSRARDLVRPHFATRELGRASSTGKRNTLRGSGPDQRAAVRRILSCTSDCVPALVAAHDSRCPTSTSKRGPV